MRPSDKKLLNNKRYQLALSVLGSKESKAFFKDAYLTYPKLSIFWTEDSAILEDDNLKIEIT